MTKRWFALVVVALLGSLFTAPVWAKDKLVIEFWHQFGSGDPKTAIDALVDDFNKESTDIEVHAIAVPDMQSKVKLAIVGGASPDVVYGLSAQEFVLNKSLLDLTDWAKRDRLPETFFPSALEESMVNGRIYGLPVYLTMNPVLLYRIDRVSEAGLAQTAPLSWEELRTYERKLTKRSDGLLTQIGFNWSPGGASVTFPTYYYVAGGRSVDNTGKKVAFNSDLGLKVLSWMGEARTFYGTEAEIGGFYNRIGSSEGKDAFVAGSLVITARGNWWARSYEQRGMRPGTDFGSWPMPAFVENEPLQLPLSAPNLTIPVTAPHAQAAWTFIKWLTSKEPATKWSLMRGLLPGNKFAARDPKFRTLPFWNDYLQLAETAGVSVRNGLYIPAQVEKEMDAAYKEVLAGQNSPKTALEAAAKRAQAVLDDFWAKVK